VTADRLRKIREYGITAGTLGSTAGQTVMVALLPILLAEYAPSAVWIGFAIGGEGVFALLVPYWIGELSDRLPDPLARRWGRRTLFLFLTAPIMAAAMAAAPFVSGYWPLAALAFVYFAAFHGYLTPLWALMVDAVPEARLATVHGVRGALHAAGLGYGLVVGGFLFALWPPLPFLLGALLILVTTSVTMSAASRLGVRDDVATGTTIVRTRTVLRELAERPAVRGFLVANAAWTGAVDGIRPYIFLFAVAVLAIDTAETSALLLLLVSGIGIGSVLLGRLGDRFGRVPLLAGGALVTAFAMLLGVLVRELDGAVALLLASGLGAAALIALPYPIFAALVGNQAIGRYTGLYILSLGLARVAAPVLVGMAIDLARPLFPEYGGYPAMWPVAGIMALIGAIELWRALGRTRAP